MEYTLPLLFLKDLCGTEEVTHRHLQRKKNRLQVVGSNNSGCFPWILTKFAALGATGQALAEPRHLSLGLHFCSKHFLSFISESFLGSKCLVCWICTLILSERILLLTCVINSVTSMLFWTLFLFLKMVWSLEKSHLNLDLRTY